MLRIRGNCGLRWSCAPCMKERRDCLQGLFSLLNAAARAFLGGPGKMFFKALEGSCAVKAEYDKPKANTERNRRITRMIKLPIIMMWRFRVYGRRVLLLTVHTNL
jgi:hypothetical protein